MNTKLLATSILVLYIINIVSSTILPYGYNQNYGYPNSASGGAVGGRFPQANGRANSGGYGPSINVNPVNNAQSESDTYPSNTQQANTNGRGGGLLGGGLGCGFGYNC